MHENLQAKRSSASVLVFVGKHAQQQNIVSGERYRFGSIRSTRARGQREFGDHPRASAKGMQLVPKAVVVWKRHAEHSNGWFFLKGVITQLAKRTPL